MRTAYSEVTFGRSQELERLRDVVAHLQDGASTLVLTGTAGIGKSHLLRHLHQDVRQAGALVVAGGCLWVPGVVDDPAPFGPIREAVHNASRTADGTPADRALQGLKTWLDPQATAAQATWLDPMLHLQERFLEALVAIAKDQPVVLSVEDVQWTDRATAALLAHLVHTLRDQPVLVALTARPVTNAGTTPASLLTYLHRQRSVTWIEVPPIDRSAVDQLVTWSAEVDERHRGRIARLAAGNPLACIELARASTQDRVPATVAASVAERVSLSPAAAVTAAHTAAVLGERVAHRDLVAVLRAWYSTSSADPRQLHALPDVRQTASGRTSDEPVARRVDQAIDQAVDAGLLWPDGDGYRFSHALEREAVYSGTRLTERARLHAAAARVLEPRGSAADAGAWAVAAAHWAAAGEVRETVRTSFLAAQSAAATGAFPVAFEHQVRALDGVYELGDGWRGPSQPAGPDRVDQETLKAAEYSRWSGEPERGLAELERRTRATPGGGSPLVWERIGWFRREIGDNAGAAAAYEHALAALESDPDPATQAQVLAGQAALQMTRFELDRALETCRRGLAAADGVRTATLSNLLNTEGVITALTGDPDAGLALLEESKHVALEVFDEAAVWRYAGNTTFVLLNFGRVDEAVDVALAAYRRAERAHVERSLAALPVIGNAVAGLIVLGRWAEAEELATRALEGTPPSSQRSLLRSYLGTVRIRQGKDSEAAADLAAARAVPADQIEPTVLVRLDELEAELSLAAGNVESARSAVDAALARALMADDHEVRCRLLALAARIEADLGGRRLRERDARIGTLAHTLAQEAHGDSEASVGEPAGPTENTSLIELAAVELARSTGSDTPAAWSTVADLFAVARDPYQTAYAHLRRTEAALRVRDRRAASAALATARAVLESLGPSRLAAEVDALARRHHLATATTTTRPDPRPPRAAAAGLTAREVEVLALLVEGASNREIGRTLTMSEKTASVHVSRLLAKLGASSRTEAAAIAHRQRLLGCRQG